MLTVAFVFLFLGAGLAVAAQFGRMAQTESDIDNQIRLMRYEEEMHDGDTTPASAPPTLRNSEPGKEFGEEPGDPWPFAEPTTQRSPR